MWAAVIVSFYYMHLIMQKLIIVNLGYFVKLNFMTQWILLTFAVETSHDMTKGCQKGIPRAEPIREKKYIFITNLFKLGNK